MVSLAWEREKEWAKKNPELYRARKKDWYERNKERISRENKLIGKERVMANKAYYDKHPEKLFERSLKFNHGMTVRDYNELHAKHDGKCAICKISDPRAEDPKALKGLLHIDHCHKTEKIRGLLCKSCNLMIGLGKDNPEILISAAAYLKERGGGDSEY